MCIPQIMQRETGWPEADIFFGINHIFWRTLRKKNHLARADPQWGKIFSAEECIKLIFLAGSVDSISALLFTGPGFESHKLCKSDWMA